jgi:acetyltransferase-like isoleucine patch superfamily enzyme
MLQSALLWLLRPISTRLERLQHEALKRSLGSCGNNVVIGQPTRIEAPHKVAIGNDVAIAPYVHMWGNAGIRIGDRTMIASHVAISSATHDPDAPVMRRTLVERPIVIEDDVWIGAHAVILPGVTIGARAVVGAGSVVDADVAPDTVVAGVPAGLLRRKAACGGPQ